MQAIICTIASLLQRKTEAYAFLCMQHIKTGEKHLSQMELNYCSTTGIKRSLSQNTHIPHCAHPGPEPEAPLLSQSAEITEISLCVRKHHSKVITQSLHRSCVVKYRG